jgi:hypothetical protein
MCLPIPQFAVSATPAEMGVPFAGDIAGKMQAVATMEPNSGSSLSDATRIISSHLGTHFIAFGHN